MAAFNSAVGLALALWSVPTLQEVETGKHTRPFTLQILSQQDSKFFRDNFTYNEASWRKEKRYWTLITHAFFHKDLDNLVYNIAAFLGPSVSISNLYGDAVMLFTFFGGVILSCTNPFNIKRLQQENAILHRFTAKISTQPESQSDFFGIKRMADTIGEMWNNGVSTFANNAAPIIATQTSYIGASGGVSSLLGFNCCISAKYIYNMLCGPSSSIGNGYKPDSYMHPLTWADSYHHTSTLLFSMKLIADEIYAFRYPDTQGIDHAAHIIGFTFGIGVYALVSFMKPYSFRRTR